MKKDRFNMISKRLREKLEKVGLFNSEIFSDGCFERADRYYLDISSDGSSISYITGDRISRFKSVDSGCGKLEDNVWNEELRKKFAIKARPGRVIQAVYGMELPYSDQRKVRFMLADLSDYQIMVLEGNDIAKYYNEDNYDENIGVLGSSCMRYCPSSFFEFYKQYCQMIVVMRISTSKIVARSIFYPSVESANGYIARPMMGRIYASDDIFYDMMKSYGIEKGYYIFNGGYSATEFIIGHDKYMRISEFKPYMITQNLINDEFAFLPYIDNFEYSLVLDNGMTIITPEREYIPDGTSYESWRENQDTEGTTGYGYASDYCEGCSFPCGDCWKAEHGGWYGDDSDDPCYDCYEDCSDCYYN